MKLSAKVRDLDTLRDRLSVYPRDGVLDLLLHRAQGKRRSKLKPLKVLAGSIHGMSSLTPEGDDPVGEKRARGRLEDNVEKLNSKLNRARQTALADAGDKEALHDLRKDCKRLRYTLELLPVKGKETRLKTLRLWQDLLGAIRGGDVTIGYLQAMGRLPEVDGILGKERIRRARDYEMFVRAWKENPRVWRAA